MNGGKLNETTIKPVKSYEEKTAEYIRVKNRIFNNNNNNKIPSNSLLNNQQQITILNRQQSTSKYIKISL